MSTDFNKQANTPIEVPIAGKVLKAERPNLEIIFGEIESKIISQEIGKVKQAADTFLLEGNQRLEFLLRGMDMTPKGMQLQQMVYDFLGTPSGVTHIFKKAFAKYHPELTQDEIDKMIFDDPEYAAAWAIFLCGASKNVPTAKGQEKENLPVSL